MSVKWNWLCISLLPLSGCGFIESHVPLIVSGKGVTPLPAGQYELSFREEDKPWTLQQTGVRIDKVDDHYATGFMDEAVTIVPSGKGLGGGSDGFSAFLSDQLSAMSPQQQFLLSHRGWSIGPLSEGFFVAQFPLSFRPEDLPPAQVKDDAPNPSWALGILRSVDERTWEYSFCDKCKEASIALFGTTKDCPSTGGACTTSPKIGDFVADPEKNREILRKAVENFGLKPRFKLVRVGS